MCHDALSGASRQEKVTRHLDYDALVRNHGGFHSPGTFGGAAFGLCLVVTLLVSGCSSRSTTQEQSFPWQAAPTSIVQEVTNVPSAVFDQVGSQPTVTSPLLLKSQPPLRFDGKPGIYYMGSEPCPLCAAERWAFLVATSRFGAWSTLGIAQSASNDEFPNTQTFTLARSSFSSPFITVRTVERLSSHQLANGRYSTLQQPTSLEASLYSEYDTPRYFPASPGTLPFLDFGNHVVAAGPSYDPGILAGLNRGQVAADLTDPTNRVTQAIVGTANYLAAAICSIDARQPRSVCTSSGVTQAMNFENAGQGVGSCPAAPQNQSVCGGPKSSMRRS
jgi:hypothetical protein